MSSAGLLEYSNSSFKGNGANETSLSPELEEVRIFQRLLPIILPIVFGLIVVVGLFGNLLVIIVVITNKQMRNTTNILIVSLALADLFFIVFCVPFTGVTYALPLWPFGDVWCKIVKYLTYVCAYASVYTLVLMSLDRYLAVVHPIRSIVIRTRKNAYIAVFLVWIPITGANIPTIFHFGVNTYSFKNETRMKCINMEVGQLTQGFFFAFGYLIPLTLICVLYWFMLKRLLYGGMPRESQSTETMRSKRRVTRMVVTVVVVFAICWLPIQIILTVQKAQLYPQTIPFVFIQIVSQCLAYMNSCVNPILYAFLSESFWKSFSKILLCFLPPSSLRKHQQTHSKNNEETIQLQAV